MASFDSSAPGIPPAAGPLPLCDGLVAIVARARSCTSTVPGHHRPGVDGESGCGWECVELWVAAVTQVRLAALAALPDDCAYLV